MYRKPCASDGRNSELLNVEEAVENRPPLKPNTDDVEIPYDVKGNMLFTRVEVAIVVTFPSEYAVTMLPKVQGVVVPKPPPEPPEPTIEIGEDPITVKPVQDTEPEHEAVVVATPPKVVLPLALVKYAS